MACLHCKAMLHDKKLIGVGGPNRQRRARHDLAIEKALVAQRLRAFRYCEARLPERQYRGTRSGILTAKIPGGAILVDDRRRASGTKVATTKLFELGGAAR